jgi:HK97 family phage major capsid protein
MAYNNVTSRTDAGALIPEEVSNEFLHDYAPAQSAALTQFRRVPVGRGQVRLPVLSALPMAYWVTGDTGLKQTTEVNWANKFLNVEEMATIMPVPDNVIADTDANIWDEAIPLIAEAFGRCLDQAVFFGTNAPASFPSNILASAVAAGNTVTEASTAAQGGFFGDIDAALSLVEADGYEPTGFVAATSAKGKFRTARNTQGDRLDGNRVDGNLSSLDGLPVTYPMRGLFPTGAGTGVRLFAGDWSQFVIGIRQDISMKILDQAVIQDNTGAIIYNLAQQDMTAVRLTFRLGWQVSNAINNDQATESARYPVSVLRTAS